MAQEDRPLYWIGSSRDDLREFPAEARRKAGFELRAVQRGDRPTDVKPMPDVGRGVEEIRIQAKKDAYRVFYVARFAETVYVLHTFQKTTRKTPKKDMELGRQRYRAMLLHRKQQGGKSRA